MSVASLHLDRDTLLEISFTVPLFAGVGEADLSMLLKGAQIEKHGDGVELCTQGTPAERFFVVLDGHIELFMEEKGRRSVIEIAQKPSVVGEAALFQDGVYAHSARVVGYAKVLVLHAAPFVSGLEMKTDLALRMLGAMSIRLRGLIQQIGQLKLKTTAQRLAVFLLGLTTKTEGMAKVRFPYDKRLAAENLGMSAESLSRALMRLAELGVESRADNEVVISDITALRDFCVEVGE